MQKLALKLTICLAALAAGGAARAENPTGLWIGNSGTVGLEVTKCGEKLCGRFVRLRDEADEKSCDAAKPASKGFFDGGWIFGTGKNTETDDNLGALDIEKLKFLADVGSKIFTEPMTWKRATKDVKRCEEPPTPVAPKAAAPKAPMPVPMATPKADPAPAVAEKNAPAPAKRKIVKVVKPRPVAKPSPALAQRPSGEAGKARVAGSSECKRYSSQIGGVIAVPCT
jgi:hypothetical protein